MKVIKKVLIGLLASGAIVSLNACAAAQQPNADSDFSIMGLEGEQGHGGRHRGGHKMMAMFFKDLNLSDAQQAELQALREQSKADFKANRGQHKEIKAALKSAFLSEGFDLTALKTQLEDQQPDAQQMAQKMSTQLIAAWQVLTPEQQAQVEQKLTDMQGRFAKMEARFGAQKGADKGAQHIQKMAEKLDLSTEQQAQLEALWTQNKPQRQEMMQEIKQIQGTVLAELKSGQASPEKLASLLEPVLEKMTGKRDQHLNRMSELHAVLTPAQREKMVQQMEERATNFHEGRRGPGRHGPRNR